MKWLATFAIGATALVALGCGDDDDNGTATASTAGAKTTGAGGAEGNATGAATAAARVPRTGKAIKVVDSDYGRVVADGKGEAFYLFDLEKGKKSRCYGACAKAWPPAITRGKPRARGGAKAGLLGTTRRKNGKLQVTYRGHPLYYYVDDAPGLILCQDVFEYGGLWLVVKPNGNPVT